MKQVIHIHPMSPMGNLALTMQNSWILYVLLKIFCSPAIRSVSYLDNTHF